MELRFINNNNIQVDHARIIYRNFSGQNSKFPNSHGFALLIDDENVAHALADAGWTVHIKPAKEPGDIPFMYVQVTVKYDPRTTIVMQTGNELRILDENTMGIIDNIEIEDISMDLHLSRKGAAYMNNLRVTQKVNRFRQEYEKYQQACRPLTDDGVSK